MSTDTLRNAILQFLRLLLFCAWPRFALSQCLKAYFITVHKMGYTLNYTCALTAVLMLWI